MEAKLALLVVVTLSCFLDFSTEASFLSRIKRQFILPAEFSHKPSVVGNTPPPRYDCNVDGETYANGAKIPKEDPCLDCTCMEGEEECSSMRKKCPLPKLLPGCKLIYKTGVCCPQIHCIALPPPPPPPPPPTLPPPPPPPSNESDEDDTAPEDILANLKTAIRKAKKLLKNLQEILAREDIDDPQK